METLIRQLVDRFLHGIEDSPYIRPDLITRVSDLVIVSGSCELYSPGVMGAEVVDVPSGRYPVYVGTFASQWARPPEAVPDWQIASTLFVPLAEPERIAGARTDDELAHVGLWVEGYVTLNDEEALQQAWRLPSDPIQGQPMKGFLRDVEGSVKAGQLGAPSTWPSFVVDDKSGWNVLAVPMVDGFLYAVRWTDDEELLAVMYLTFAN
jgi:hypothetical protein